MMRLEKALDEVNGHIGVLKYLPGVLVWYTEDTSIL